MKRIALILLFLLVPNLVRAQQKKALSAASATCTTTSCLSVTVDQTQGGATFTISANPSGNTIQFEASGDGGSTVVAISATPSNSTTAVTSTTGTGVWQVNTSGYTNLYLRMSTLVGGTTTVSIIQGLPSARGGSGGGGGGGGGGSSGGAGLDCSTFPGADLGAKWLACVAAAPNGGLVSLGNFTSPQTLSTAVTITRPVTTNCGGIFINQSAPIVLGDNTFTFVGTSLISTPDQICTFNKTANIDQLTVDGSSNYVSFINLIGNRGTGKTGSGLITSSGSFNAIIEGVFISQQATDDILDSGGNNTFKDSILATYGANGLVTSGFLPVIDNVSITDSSDSTGSALVSTGIITKAINLNIQTVGLAAAISNPTERLWISQSLISQSNNYPAITSPAGNLIVTNSNISGGGTHGADVVSTGILQLDHDEISNASHAVDVIQAGGGAVRITNNVISFTRLSGNSAINLNAGPSIGAIISGNQVSFNTADTPSGDNYGIRFTIPAMGDFLQNLVKDNIINANNKATDHGFFFDNGLGNVTANFNRIEGNQCVDMSISTCIVRTDAIGEHTIYQDNETNLGTAGLYAAGGGVNDIVIQLSSSFTFATLPTAGNGSQLYCSDCTAGVLAASGAGGMIFYMNGRWGNIEPTTAPTVSSGFGTGAAVSANPNGPTAFRLGVGTSNTGTGVVALPAAKTGWNCYATDITTKSTLVAATLQTASTTASATFQNYTDVVGTHAWVDSDVLAISCFAY
jgi:hypothetical protein